MRIAVFLFAAVVSFASAQPEPWVHPDGSIHYYSAVAAPAGINWSAASDSAQRPGGYLATLTSQAENDFVFGLVDSSVYWYQRPDSDWAGPWLGGRQRFGSPEPDSGWEWAGGEPFSYGNWSPGEPDNQDGANVLNFGESPNSRSSTWNDLSETDTAIHGFVVELSAESTTIGLLQNDTNTFVGYSLFESNRSGFAFLIDNKGLYVHSWYSTYKPGLSNYLLEDGSLLHTACVGNPDFTAGGNGGRVERFDWDGNLTWAYEYSSTLHCQHHDVEPLPNGNVLLVAWELKSRAEAIAAGRNPAKITANKLWPDHVVEVNPANDSIVWEWHVWDHLIQDFDSTKANYGVVADHSELVDLNYTQAGPQGNGADWIHTNAVDYNPEFDQIIISAHNVGEVWVIDHSTTTAEAQDHSGGHYGMGGDLLYRWGNPQAYRAGGTADRKFFGQHDSRWIEPGLPGEGHLTVFNNGLGRPGDRYSTVDEFIPACDSAGNYARPAPGTPFGPAAQCWMYAATPPTSFYSAAISGAHRLPNGNTLICEGNSGFFFEVTADTHVVWRYLNPVTDSIRLFQGDTVPGGMSGKQNNTFRVTRYAPDYPGLNGRDLTPGYPIERYHSLASGLAEAPARLGLAPAAISVHPNPAQGQAAIRYQIRSAGRVRLAIYDLLGNTVTVLADCRQAPGTYDATWNGLTGAGDKASPGVYLCRLTTDGAGATGKILLTR
jgi:hypothetical protein